MKQPPLKSAEEKKKRKKICQLRKKYYGVNIKFQ